MMLEKLKKSIKERQEMGAPLEYDADIFERIESGYFEETKDFIVVHLENKVKNKKGEAVLEQIAIKKKILGRDMLRIDRSDSLSIVALLLGVDKGMLKYIPAFLAEVIFTYFGEGLALKDRSNEIEEKGGCYVYQLDEPVHFEDETLKELKVLTTNELNVEHLSKMMMEGGSGLFDVLSQVFAVKKELIEAMAFADLDAASKILDKLKKKRW